MSQLLVVFDKIYVDICELFLGPTVLAKIVGPKIMSSTKYVTPCTPFRLFPTCKSASVGAVLRNVKFILVFYVGTYTGHSCCIVKLPDEVCVSHTKRVGENKSFYNCKSSQTCCSLVLSKKFMNVSISLIFI